MNIEKHAMSLAGALILLALSVGAAYVGVGTYLAVKAIETIDVTISSSGAAEYEKIPFRDAGEVMRFRRQEKLGQSFPWAASMPVELLQFAMATAFGLLGGVAAVLKRIVMDKRPIGTTPFIGRPLFGMVVGLMLFALSYVIPSILTTGRSPLRAEAVLGFALLGGLFAEDTYLFVQKKTNQFFKKKGG